MFNVFSWMRQTLAQRAASRQLMQQQAQRLAVALVRQAQAAGTLRQLAMVLSMLQAMPWRQAALRALVRQQVALRLVQLPAPLAPNPRQPSRKSSSSKTRRGKSTTRRRP
jgi:hypothetical protein